MKSITILTLTHQLSLIPAGLYLLFVIMLSFVLKIALQFDEGLLIERDWGILCPTPVVKTCLIHGHSSLTCIGTTHRHNLKFAGTLFHICIQPSVAFCFYLQGRIQWGREGAWSSLKQ